MREFHVRIMRTEHFTVKAEDYEQAVDIAFEHTGNVSGPIKRKGIKAGITEHDYTTDDRECEEV